MYQSRFFDSDSLRGRAGEIDRKNFAQAGHIAWKTLLLQLKLTVNFYIDATVQLK